ncbi:phosphoacetylglucosamine mutase-like isoform X2 [Corticium candelabrum]|uniref:phosphoacetylglucosamine mutase-like isoform X2 n=1 Tax=Corticium candelabrum TaxID=121492 RepID=UPI002E27738E|nr:phosphoacetylglucosamine mutase-like isoform X2 [Corticium candelabrum]
MEKHRKKIEFGARQHPKLEGITYNYGTAGFREKADKLDAVMYRMGLLAVLRSKKTKVEVGLMVTASHNPVEDNGVKLVDPMGLMLTENWEPHATHVANCSDLELVDTLQRVAAEEQIDAKQKVNVIIIGYDTRPSSKRFASSIQDGVEAFDEQVFQAGCVTTPQLHYLVRGLNTQGVYGDATEEGYYMKLGLAFWKLNGSQGIQTPVYVDGANGVGAEKVPKLLKYINEGKCSRAHFDKKSHLQAFVSNDGSQGILNDRCGADYVKIKQKPPVGMDVIHGKRYCTFDGDADRIMYFYVEKDGAFKLLDGDKICILLAEFFFEHWQHLELPRATFGVVQTAYANGSSTKYLNEKGIRVVLAPTGVKHITKKAEEFDVGVAYEANGHGNLIVKEKTWNSIIACSRKRLRPTDRQKARSAEVLENLINLVNQCVGDALSNMLVVETILNLRKLTIEEWAKCYDDLPNRQLKVKVRDRSVIKTTWDETKVIEPAALQRAIDVLVGVIPCARSFVRPSGTEDCVRVYSEAETQELADTLAYGVAVVGKQRTKL